MINFFESLFAKYIKLTSRNMHSANSQVMHMQCMLSELMERKKYAGKSLATFLVVFFFLISFWLPLFYYYPPYCIYHDCWCLFMQFLLLIHLRRFIRCLNSFHIFAIIIFCFFLLPAFSSSIYRWIHRLQGLQFFHALNYNKIK